MPDYTDTQLAEMIAAVDAKADALAARVAALEATPPVDPPPVDPPPVDPPPVDPPDEPNPPASTGTLSWAPPALTNPTTIDVTSCRTVTLDPAKDYVLRLPTDKAITGANGLKITGGRRVVLIGGHIHHDDWYGTPYNASDSRKNCGLIIENPGEVLFIEGLRIDGVITDAIRVSSGSRGPTDFYFQNIHVPDPVRGRKADWHADVMQAWTLWGRMFVDGLAGVTEYQGIRLSPKEIDTGQPGLSDLTLRRVAMTGAPQSEILYTLWNGNSGEVQTKVVIDQVYANSAHYGADPVNLIWDVTNPRSGSGWNDVTATNLRRFTGTKFGPAPFTIPAGAGYQSPGYR
ncbi:MAG TPA: hypothetical protein VGE43_19480 [Acidimicrobiales bacterium]